MSMVEINWNPKPKDLRIFGASNLVILSFLAGIFFWHGHETTAAVVLVVGVVSGGLGLTGTRAALPLYYVFMGFGMVMGNIISPVLVALLYFVVVTPIGIVRRLCGNDKLQLKGRGKTSYWCDIVPGKGNKESYERQF